MIYNSEDLKKETKILELDRFEKEIINLTKSSFRLYPNLIGED